MRTDVFGAFCYRFYVAKHSNFVYPLDYFSLSINTCSLFVVITIVLTIWSIKRPGGTEIAIDSSSTEMRIGDSVELEIEVRKQLFNILKGLRKKM